MSALKTLFEPTPDWYTASYQTGFKSPWTGDLIGRYERHCLKTGRMQMRINSQWLDYKKGDELDRIWRSAMELSLIKSFGDKFKAEHGRTI